jgi:CrcB protein
LLKIILIFIGAGLGGILRFLMSKYLSILLANKLPNNKFVEIYPYPTLAINILGSFMIGLASSILINKFPNYNSEIKIFIMTGLLGGFTTFSSFSLETVNLLYEGYTYVSFTYILLSLSLCILCCMLGITLGKIL